MAYIDRDYLNSLFSSAQVDKLLAYGSSDSSEQLDKLNTAISGACDYVDSFLEPAGYDVPFSSPPVLVKHLAGYRALYQLHFMNGQTVPAELNNQLVADDGMLIRINQGSVTLPGKAQDTATGTGGHYVVSGSSAGGKGFSGLRGNWA